MTPAGFIFDRETERQALRDRLQNRRSFLLHGPAGVGKTLLLTQLLLGLPSIIYCEASTTPQGVFRSFALSLLSRHDRHVQASCRNEATLKAKSALALKGIVRTALREGSYSLVLDHLQCPSPSFKSFVREMMESCSTPVIAVARSAHMEHRGSLQSLYPDRSEKYELRNFEPAPAAEFVRQLVSRLGLRAANLDEFSEKIIGFSAGNPGAIASMARMAREAKYRSGEQILLTPLHIDFRMFWEHGTVQ